MDVVFPPALGTSSTRIRARVSRIWNVGRRNAARAVGPLVRRGMDVVLGGAALVASAPIVAAAAALVKLTSPGPAFVRQTRVGKDGRTFLLYKIRTMHADAERRRAELEHLNESRGGVTFKIKADPRVTPL